MGVSTHENELDSGAAALPSARLRGPLGGRLPGLMLLAGCALAGPPGAAPQPDGWSLPVLTQVARRACAAGHAVDWVMPFIETAPSGEKIRLAVLYLERLP